MAEINIKGVAKSFGAFTALHAIDLDVADREFLVLLGASGCGKTTLLRLIAGLDYPTAGEISIGGKRVNDLPPRARGIAMVFQNYAVFPHLTVFENIAFGLRMKKLPQADIDRRVKSVAGLMHIDMLLSRYSGQLSGGQRQRVAVARALAMEPEVLLMDEPLSNLDALLRLEMRAELKGVLQQSRTTTIYVTHDQVEAMSMGRRVGVMRDGVLQQVDTPDGIYQRPVNLFVATFIGSPPMSTFPAVAEGDTVRWSGGTFKRTFGGRDLTIGVRPEHVHVYGSRWSASTEPTDRFSARVELIEALGDQNVIDLEVAGTRLRARVEPGFRPAVDETVSCWFEAQAVHAFDPSTGEAVR